MITGMTSKDTDGFAQLVAILDIIKNKTVYEKRVAELQSHKEAITKLIEVVGTVDSIDGIKQKAVVETEKTYNLTKIVEKKLISADGIIKEAQARATTIMADATSKAADQKTNMDYREKELAAGRNKLAEDTRAIQLTQVKLDTMQRNLESKLGAIEHQEGAAVKARQDFENRKQQVENLLSGI